MRCPACGAENPEGATLCASCGKAIAQAPEAAPAQAPAAPPGKRLSRLAVFAAIAVAVAPWLQVMRDEAGGNAFARLAAKSHAVAAKGYLVLTVLDTGATVLFALAIIASLVAFAEVLRRADLRGGALALAALLLAVGGMAAGTYGLFMPGYAGDLLRSLGGGSGSYVWHTTAIILAAAIVIEIVLLLVRPRTPTPAS